MFWLLALMPFAVMIGARLIYKHSLTWLESVLQFSIAVGISAIIWNTGKFSETKDIEIWNGTISKVETRRSICSTNSGGPYCRHSYQCNCRQVSRPSTCYKTVNGKSQSYSCTKYETVCDTCYRYPWERSYFALSSDINKTWEISRIDPQGRNTPPRYTVINIGDPVSKTNQYTNWIKASEFSLFNEGNLTLKEKYEGLVPEYPIKVNDYYVHDKMIQVGVDLENINEWNQILREINSRLGPTKQANIMMMLVKNQSLEYVQAVKNAWVGAKKNDIIIIVNLNEEEQITWINVISWSKSELVNVNLRDRIYEIGSLDISRIPAIIEEEVNNNYERRPMEEFEYLKNEIQPPIWVIILTAFMSLLVSVLLTKLFDSIDLSFKSIFRR